MTPAQQLNAFIAKYEPAIAAQVKSALAKMRKLLPGAIELVYDNYNALAIGFGPTERAGDGVFAIVVYPRYVVLYFLQGAKVPDPQRLLRGNGSRGRHIVLESAAQIDEPAVQDLLDRALHSAKVPFTFAGRRKLVIKAVSAKQRPRRPAK